MKFYGREPGQYDWKHAWSKKKNVRENLPYERALKRHFHKKARLKNKIIIRFESAEQSYERLR